MLTFSTVCFVTESGQVVVPSKALRVCTQTWPLLKGSWIFVAITAGGGMVTFQ